MTANVKNISVLSLAATAMISASVVSTSHANYIEDFSNPLTLSPTQAPGAWYTDRQAPAGFVATGGQLQHTISSADWNPTQSFYNTQGRKYHVDLGGPEQYVSVDLFIPSAWSTPGTDRAAGLWGTGFDGGGVTPTAYPIIAFRNTATNPAGVYVYDYADTGLYLPTAATINYDAFNTLEYRLTPGVGTTFYVNGVLGGTIADVDTTTIANVMLQGGNFNNSYTIQWDNLTAVPEPTTVGVLGVAGVGLLARRRRR